MGFAFLFPGQGSQAVGMLAEHIKKHKEIKATFEETSSALSQDLFRLISKGPEDELNLTVNTQPVMLAASVGIQRVWKSLTDRAPDIMGGHSLGEYSALVCAGAFEFADAVRVVRRRAELMQAAVPVSRGAMAVVIGLDAHRVAGLCAEAGNGEVVEAVNFNAPTQTVVAGHTTAVERLVKLAKQAEARQCMTLPVSVPAHSSLMEEASREFAAFLSTVPLRLPEVPVLHNADVATHSAADEIHKALVAQMHRPVRWVESIECMNNRGIRNFIEIGPGRVLAGLNRQIGKAPGKNPLNTFSTDTPENMDNALNAVEAR